MSDYRDRLLGFLKSQAPATRDALYAGEVAAAPSSSPRGDADLRRRFADELEAVKGKRCGCRRQHRKQEEQRDDQSERVM